MRAEEYQRCAACGGGGSSGGSGARGADRSAWRLRRVLLERGDRPYGALRPPRPVRWVPRRVGADPWDVRALPHTRQGAASAQPGTSGRGRRRLGPLAGHVHQRRRRRAHPPRQCGDGLSLLATRGGSARAEARATAGDARHHASDARADLRRQPAARWRCVWQACVGVSGAAVLGAARAQVRRVEGAGEGGAEAAAAHATRAGATCRRSRSLHAAGGPHQALEPRLRRQGRAHPQHQTA
mmetsp:Transcript_24965/g.66977  ORF Transcript_24965/g.66977 Transcript_24965/m.66977 type:complete len:240 (-) Transcript_24965:437-1156(-)